MSGLADLVVAEVKKAGPDGLNKQEIQQRTGLGTDDLREALQEAEDFVVSGGRGYLAQEFEEEVDNTAELPIPPEAQAPDRGEGPVPAAGEPDVHGFRATVEVTFEFKSEDARHAIADAKLLVEDAKDGVIQKNPSIGISTVNLVVSEFAERRVWPALESD